MIEYIYIVKCPNCEDEQFYFCDEAKGYARSCMSQKPVINQIEVNRNDFGECTDSCDLGTIWSWEDECQDCGLTDAEPAKCIFTRDDLKDYIPDEDPEFDAIDNSVDFEPITSEVSAIDEVPDNFRKPITEAKADTFHEAIFEAIDYLTEFDYMFPVPKNIGATNWEELKDDINYGLSSDFEIAEIIMEYLKKDIAIGDKHPEIFEDDPQSELTLETYNRLKRAYDRAVAAYKADHAEDFEESCRKPITESYATKEFEIPNFDAEITDEFEDEGIKGYNIVYSKNGTDIVEVEVWETDSPVAVNRNLHTPNLMQGYYSSFDAFASDLEYKTSKYIRVRESADRKPIPEGMTIEQLVEEMEENEDTVECRHCGELSDKSACKKEPGIGWVCEGCQNTLHDLGNTYDGGYPEEI